jgi:hypothetical protein
MMLAFWTQRDATRVDELFRQGGLMRAKWDERRGDSTLRRTDDWAALAGTTQVYEPSTRHASPASNNGDGGGLEWGGTGATNKTDEPVDNGFAYRVHQRRVDLLARIKEGIPPTNYLPGAHGRYVRGKRHQVAAPKKTRKSISTQVELVDMVLAGATVIVFDRENGADLYASRLEAIINARKLDDQQQQLIAANFTYYEFPRLSTDDAADFVALCRRRRPRRLRQPAHVPHRPRPQRGQVRRLRQVRRHRRLSRAPWIFEAAVAVIVTSLRR